MEVMKKKSIKILFVIAVLIIGLVGYLFISNSPDDQRLGDQIAKTVVVAYQEPKAPAKKKTTKKKE